MCLDEHQQTDPEEQGLEAAEAPDTGNNFPTNDNPEDEEDFPSEHALEAGETPEGENDPTPGEDHDNSESEEVQDAGETGEKETKEDEAINIGELKIVLHLREGRVSAGVWQPGADAHLETFMETDMSILVAEIPGLLERAQARWNENPLRPKYQPPKKTPTKKNQQRNQNKTTPTTETQPEPEPQPSMARLF